MISPMPKTDILVSFDAVLVFVSCEKMDASSISLLFDALAENNINIDLLSFISARRTSGGLSFSVFNSDFAKVLRAAAQLKKSSAAIRLEAHGDYAKIVLRSTHFCEETGVIANFFHAVHKANSEIMLISASESSIAALIRIDELDPLISLLEKEFPEAKTTYLNEYCP